MPPLPPTLGRVTGALKNPAEPTRKLVHRPRLRSALLTGAGALIVLVVGSGIKGWHEHGPVHQAFVLGPAHCVLGIGHRLRSSGGRRAR